MKHHGEMLKDDVAIVTGGGQNIGAEISKEFAREGADVAVVDIEGERAESVANEIRDEGFEATFIEANISEEEQVKRMVEKVEKKYDAVDILINNAAISDHGDILNLSVNQFNKVLQVNLVGTFLCTRECAKSMKNGHGGRIINMSSTSAHNGRGDAAAYATTKAGLVNFTRSAAIALAPYDIRVNTLSPTRTGSPVGKSETRTIEPDPDILVKRWGQPSDMAHAAKFLVDPMSEFINGTELLVDGGSSATFPGFDPDKTISPTG